MVANVSGVARFLVLLQGCIQPVAAVDAVGIGINGLLEEREGLIMAPHYAMHFTQKEEGPRPHPVEPLPFGDGGQDRFTRLLVYGANPKRQHRGGWIEHAPTDVSQDDSPHMARFFQALGLSVCGLIVFGFT